MLRPLFPQQNLRYQFPLVKVCLTDGFGCGYNDGQTDACVTSALWSSHASYGDDDGGGGSIIIDAALGQVRIVCRILKGGCFLCS